AGAGGIPEMVQHGKTGFICLPGQSNALYIHLKRLLDNPGLRAQMSKQAQEWATEYWSMSRMMTETMELYEEVTNQPS
ncbi:glycosyltransferase, partial [Paenibacillus massiliensis]